MSQPHYLDRSHLSVSLVWFLTAGCQNFGETVHVRFSLQNICGSLFLEWGNRMAECEKSFQIISGNIFSLFTYPFGGHGEGVAAYPGCIRAKAGYIPGSVTGSLQGPKWAFGEFLPCSRIPRQCFEGVLAPLHTTTTTTTMALKCFLKSININPNDKYVGIINHWSNWRYIGYKIQIFSSASLTWVSEGHMLYIFPQRWSAEVLPTFIVKCKIQILDMHYNYCNQKS